MTTEPFDVIAKALKETGYTTNGNGMHQGTGERVTTYRTALDIYNAAPESPAWLWHGYLAEGAVTLLAGRHKGGKSTLLFSLMRAFVDGHTRFLNHDLKPGPVVLLTEEAPGTLRPKLEQITHEGMQQLRVLCRDDITPNRPSWEAAVREAGMEAIDHGARIVIIDTFAFWSQITDENDSAIMQNAVAVLAELTAMGLSVVIVHHHRKGTSLEAGDSIRGSTALQGAVDLIVELFRVEDDEVITSQRELRAIGRYPEIPEIMRIQLEGDGLYRVVAEGTREEVLELTWKERVAAYLSDNYAEKHTQSQIRNALSPENPEKAKGRVHATLRQLLDEGFIQKVGEGKNDGYRWVINH